MKGGCRGTPGGGWQPLGALWPPTGCGLDRRLFFFPSRKYRGYHFQDEVTKGPRAAWGTAEAVPPSPPPSEPLAEPRLDSSADTEATEAGPWSRWGRGCLPAVSGRCHHHPRSSRSRCGLWGHLKPMQLDPDPGLDLGGVARTRGQCSLPAKPQPQPPQRNIAASKGGWPLPLAGGGEKQASETPWTAGGTFQNGHRTGCPPSPGPNAHAGDGGLAATGGL